MFCDVNRHIIVSGDQLLLTDNYDQIDQRTPRCVRIECHYYSVVKQYLALRIQLCPIQSYLLTLLIYVEHASPSNISQILVNHMYEASLRYVNNPIHSPPTHVH